MDSTPFSPIATNIATNIAKNIATTIAPAGVLRASINLGNPLLAKRDGPSGQAVGVSVDLATAFAAQLGVGLEMRVFDKAAESVRAVETGQADIGFFAIDPLRGEHIAFSGAYLLIEGCYLVRADSALRDNSQVDQSGH